MSTLFLSDHHLLKIAELARQLDVSTRTIRRYVALGRLPAPVRFSKICIRWHADEVRRCIEQLKKSGQ